MKMSKIIDNIEYIDDYNILLFKMIYQNVHQNDGMNDRMGFMCVGQQYVYMERAQVLTLSTRVEKRVEMLLQTTVCGRQV